MFKKIFCPVGLEGPSFYALPTAVAMAKAFGAELHLLHLDESFMDEDERVMLRVSVREEKEEARAKAVVSRKTILAIVHKLGYAEAISDVIMREGSPKHHLAEIAQKLGADLLVIHTHRHQGILERVKGSDAEAILHRADIPVLVLQRP